MTINYLRQLNKLLSRNSQKLEIGSVGQHLGDKLLNIIGLARDLAQVGQLFLLVLQDLEGLLHPVSEGGGLAVELDELLVGAQQTLHQLVSVVGNVVITYLN